MEKQMKIAEIAEMDKAQVRQALRETHLNLVKLENIKSALKQRFNELDEDDRNAVAKRAQLLKERNKQIAEKAK